MPLTVREWSRHQRRFVYIFVYIFVNLIITLLAAGCASAPAPAARAPAAESWPAADAMFRRDPRWLGADAAYSISLGGDRVLWLFGDTFVALTDRRLRSESVMIRNSAALQTGLNPETANIQFFWRTAAGRPDSFFPGEGEYYFWPLHGTLTTDGTLVLFGMRMRDTPGSGLGFAAAGRELFVISRDEVPLSPSEWHPRRATPAAPYDGFTAGTAVVREGPDIFALSVREPGAHDARLLRFREESIEGGRADSYDSWTASGFAPQANAIPSILMNDAGPECSVHFDNLTKQYIHIFSAGFGSTLLAARNARQLTGPWSEAKAFFRAPECNLADVLVYAGKAHPELDAGRDTDGAPFLAATYATNSLQFAKVIADSNLYYPRFVRIRTKALFTTGNE